MVGWHSIDSGSTGESWIDGLDWTPVEVGNRASLKGSGRSMIHAGDGFLLPAEAVVEDLVIYISSWKRLLKEDGMLIKCDKVIHRTRYRTHSGPRLAGLRMLLIVMGFVISASTNLAIKPKFVGKDLHQMVSDHFSKIAVSLDACVQAYLAGARSAELQKVLEGSEPEDEVHEAYKTVIHAKGDEDLLVVTFE